MASTCLKDQLTSNDRYVGSEAIRESLMLTTVLSLGTVLSNVNAIVNAHFQYGISSDVSKVLNALHYLFCAQSR
ncbi:hypothetical protein H4J45_18065 [Colwellia sp. BRX10-6]|uniref:hypothetical protein n=1 Tax=unclassified Colwellia TaxID=196834 RepID=UPI0015F66624|nr:MULTISPECIES: hypothetical protein [unclassified Colwellia]MBA6385153.1 hypothetical protein [Colwellia sp. BRX10-9]MBA6395990.1 hypothetical protein [Colwellia sp. BRX10-6]